MHLAVGTSFAIIIPTSMVSVYTHNKHNSVDPNIVKTYGLFVVIGVLVGTTFAAMAKTKSLVIFFTVVVFCLGTYLLINSNQQTISKNKFKLHFRIIFGLISVVIPWFFFLPITGKGFMGNKTPNPNLTKLLSTCSHVVLGIFLAVGFSFLGY